MGTPEIHIHTHIHLDPDVLTVHPAISAATRKLEEAGQLSVFDQPQEEIPAVITHPPTLDEPKLIVKKTASAVPIMPQTPEEQRDEMKLHSDRDAHLADTDFHFGAYNTRASEVKRVESGLAKMTFGEFSSLKKNRDSHKGAAKQAFQKACGSCALADMCQIEDDFPAWGRVHKYATKGGTAGQETRDKWRKRVITAGRAGTQAPCLPEKSSQKQASRAD